MKKFKKSKSLFIIIGIGVFVFVSILILFRVVENSIFENKTTFSITDVKFAVNKIYRENMGFKSDFNLRFSEHSIGFKNYPYYESIISKMSGDQFVISSSGGDGFFKIHTKPTEIAATIECILYFADKELPGELLGIANSQSTGGVSNYLDNKTFFTPEDVQELCKIVDVAGLSRGDAAKKLAAFWIEETGYVKR